MSAVEQFQDELGGAFGSMVLAPIATMGALIVNSVQQTTPSMTPASELSVNLIVSLLQSMPGMITLAGIIGATLVAGPFGFVGATFEAIGTTLMLYYQSQVGFWLVVVGAVLVVVGRYVPWTEVLGLFRSSGRRY